MQSGVDRRIAGIIRWLERFQSSYRSGAMESALLDAECARADLEDLRSAIWGRVETPRRPWTVRKICAAAAVILLATAAPLALDPAPERASPPFRLRTRIQAVSLKPEGEIEREMESETTPEPAVRAENRAAEARPEVRAEARSEKRTARAEPRKKPEKRQEIRAQQSQQAQKSVPYDKVFSLLQTGNRALRTGDPAIQITKIGKGENSL